MAHIVDRSKTVKYDDAMSIAIRLAVSYLVVTASVAAGCVRKEAPEVSPFDAGAAGLMASNPSGPRKERPPAITVPSPTKELQHQCDVICQHSLRLKCSHVEECIPNCLAMASLTPCSSQIGRLYGCLTSQPSPNWECAGDGVAAIRDGFCDKEQRESVACMEAKMEQP